MARAYEQIAVDALHSTISSNLGAALTAIDSSLPLPKEYVKAAVPADNRSPLVQIYDRETVVDDAGQRNALAAVDCDVVVTYNGGTDLAANEDKLRKYMEALRDVLAANPTLDGTVSGAWWTDASRDFAIESDSATRSSRFLGVTVVVHDPT